MKFSHLPKIYANIKLIKSTLLNLDKAHIHYFTTVLRLKIGDNFRIFNGIDGAFIAQIVEVTKSNLTAQINNIFREITPE